jgi:hypothetical protein
MKGALNLIMATVAALVLSGCMGAALNKIELTLNRNITVGQELMDLQEAHEKGIISDTEYMETKKDILNLFDQLGDMNGSKKSKKEE